MRGFSVSKPPEFHSRRTQSFPLSPAAAALDPQPKVSFDEKAFRFALNEDAMATEKTAEGIRLFSADIVKLEQLIQKKRG